MINLLESTGRDLVHSRSPRSLRRCQHCYFNSNKSRNEVIVQIYANEHCRFNITYDYLSSSWRSSVTSSNSSVGIIKPPPMQTDFLAATVLRMTTNVRVFLILPFNLPIVKFVDNCEINMTTLDNFSEQVSLKSRISMVA